MTVEIRSKRGGLTFASTGYGMLGGKGESLVLSQKGRPGWSGYGTSFPASASLALPVADLTCLGISPARRVAGGQREAIKPWAGLIIIAPGMEFSL